MKESATRDSIKRNKMNEAFILSVGDHTSHSLFISPWWRHRIKKFPHYCPFVRGLLWSQVDPLHNWPVMWRFDVWFAVIQYQLSYRNFSCRWFEMQWRSYDVSVVLYCSVYLYSVCIAPLYPYYLSASINSSPLDKMATISQTILSDAHAFSWMKSFIFWLNFPRWDNGRR